ncbi:AbrB family transcriptional regulator [Edaphobacter acidisoli]|uniref:AbrB family transcriptional regulator n=1 Tax=Edaphobacter acidisoli TaxID=2040573 RepID=A0A916RID8_9BACT|nr:AbrB/MazE/SpoVT family DNA-binding domain-containing protein [Edaphobacter acidisoli]GGA56914.1 AbrB family transcriptional regulator [Edaphobacter acidisoli]
MESALTIKGQITIPKAMREKLHLAPGDKVKFFLHPDGSLAILPKLPASSLRGMLRYSGPPVSLAEMEAGIAHGATARYRRYQRQK